MGDEGHWVLIDAVRFQVNGGGGGLSWPCGDAGRKTGHSKKHRGLDLREVVSRHLGFSDAQNSIRIVAATPRSYNSSLTSIMALPTVKSDLPLPALDDGR